MFPKVFPIFHIFRKSFHPPYSSILHKLDGLSDDFFFDTSRDELSVEIIDLEKINLEFIY